MPLPLITTNMYFDTVLKAIEIILKAESVNQIALGGTGWTTVRERFDPLGTAEDSLNPGIVNVVWSASNFPDGEGTSFEQKSISSFDIDCYATQIGLESGGTIIPKDQRVADVLHSLVTKVYYTIMSPIYYDLGLTPGTIVRPWVTSALKFVPSESNISTKGVLAVRMACRIKFEEKPPEGSGVDLEVINIDTNRDDDVDYVDQTINP